MGIGVGVIYFIQEGVMHGIQGQKAVELRSDLDQLRSYVAERINCTAVMDPLGRAAHPDLSATYPLYAEWRINGPAGQETHKFTHKYP